MADPEVKEKWDHVDDGRDDLRLHGIGGIAVVEPGMWVLVNDKSFRVHSAMDFVTHYSIIRKRRRPSLLYRIKWTWVGVPMYVPLIILLWFIEAAIAVHEFFPRQWKKTKERYQMVRRGIA